MRKCFTALALTLMSTSASAQALKNVDFSTTLGTGPVQCVPPNSAYKTLLIENPYGGSNNIGYCVAVVNGNTCTPVIGALGTSVLTPGNSDYWPQGSAPIGGVFCVASAGSTPVTIRAGQ